MSFVPVYFRNTLPASFSSHHRDTLPLSPAARSVALPQPDEFADPSTGSDGPDVSDLADDIHAHSFTRREGRAFPRRSSREESAEATPRDHPAHRSPIPSHPPQSRPLKRHRWALSSAGVFGWLLIAAGIQVLGSPARANAALPIALPTPQGFVTDLAGIIDAPTRAEIDRIDRSLRQATGAEIAVVTVRSTQPETAFDYATALFEKWKPGSREKDNGVLFLVAVDDRQMQIITGYGAEGVLPDGRVGEIRDRIVVPAFRALKFSQGILAATQEMARLIAADAGVTLAEVPAARAGTETTSLRAMMTTFLLVLLAMIVIQVLSQALHGGTGRSARRGPRIGGMGGGFGGGFGGGGFGGGFGGSSSGGFGGFGGGRTGGGGAGGGW